jgi:hypothetical protein
MQAKALFSRLAFQFTPAPRYVAAAQRAIPASNDEDDAIRRDLLTQLEREPWWDARTSNVFVDNGVVVYQGLITDRHTRQSARRLAEAHPGVCGVWDARVPRREWQAMA